MSKGSLPIRNEINEEYKWNLSDVYPSIQEWEDDFQRVKELIPRIQSFKGKLTTAEQLLSCLQLQDELGLLLEKLFSYAFMGKDQDNTDTDFQSLADRIMSLGVTVSSSVAFIEPEILSLSTDEVKNWIKQTPGLKVYSHYLDDILRTKPHTLATEQEELLAGAGEIAQAPGKIFQMFNNADLTFPLIKDEEGHDVELTHGRYIQFLQSKNRDVRKTAFTAMYDTYGNWENMLATTYTSQVKQAAFYARVRNYNSSIEASLDVDNVNIDVYQNLIETIHSHLPLFYRYTKLRKNLLRLDELHMYDLYVPIFQDVDRKVPYTEAMEKVKESLKPLGEQYLQDLSKSFTDGWIDWFENKGKTSGAYSRGVYSVHPYVLMNYQDNVNSMFTLAHELGHAMHSYYSDQNQEYINSNYTIFVAEVASTLNEALLMTHLLENTTDKQEKLYLLNHYLEQFRGTCFRQTMFAEFEMIVHEKICNEEPLPAEKLSEIYYKLNEKYYGPEIVVDENIAMEWARVPHFYRPFYVYKYATGFAAAVALSKQILSEGEEAVRRYLEFLKSGGSDYPINLLQKAGVDMTTAAPITQAMEVFADLVKEVEELSEA